MSGDMTRIRGRLREAAEQMEQAGQDRAEVERERYRLRLMELRSQIMELSAHPLASKSDKLILKGMQSTAGRLGNDYPLTAHGRRTLQRVQSRERVACAVRVGRGCPRD